MQKRNRRDDEEMNLTYRADGRIEWTCPHSIGHTVYYPTGSDAVHGCDRCCQSEEFKEIRKMILHILILEGIIDWPEYKKMYLDGFVI